MAAQDHQTLNVVGPPALPNAAQSLAQALRIHRVGVEVGPPVRQWGVRAQGVVVQVVRAEVPVQLPHVLAPAQNLTNETLDGGQRGGAVPVRLFGCRDGVEWVQHPQVQRHRQQRVRHRPVFPQHGVLVAAEQRQPFGDETPQGFVGLGRCHREQSGPVHPDSVEVQRIEVAAYLRVDVVFHRTPGRRHVQRRRALRRRLPVVGVEVPSAIHRLIAVHQHPEPAALLAVEVLQPEAFPLAGPRAELRAPQREGGGGQHVGHQSVAA